MSNDPKGEVDARVIPLTHGCVAIVDSSDYEWLSKWTWRAYSRAGQIYAVRDTWVHEQRFRVAMHQMLVGDVPEGHVIHHRNGIGIDNRRGNLLVGPRGLALAMGAPRRTGKFSDFRGVYLIYVNKAGEVRWQATITVKGERIGLGVFESEIEAAIAWDKEAVRIYGPGVHVNFPEKLAEYEALARQTRKAPPLLPRRTKARVQKDLNIHE